MDNRNRFVREREARDRSGLSRSTRYRMEQAGTFPARRQISAGTTGYLESEFEAWLKDRLKQPQAARPMPKSPGRNGMKAA
jgi:prophage regulatory protein